MKNIFYLGLAALTLCGCAQSRQNQTDIKELQEQVAHLQAVQEQDAMKISRLASQQSDNSQIQDYNNGPIDPRTGLPVSAEADTRTGPLDPRTGHPFDAELIVFPPSGEVTETNGMYWRWTVKFAVGNPNRAPATTCVTILFSDASGHILDTDTEVNLRVPAYSTNSFTTYQFINLPSGAAVKSITDERMPPIF